MALNLAKLTIRKKKTISPAFFNVEHNFSPHPLDNSRNVRTFDYHRVKVKYKLTLNFIACYISLRSLHFAAWIVGIRYTIISSTNGLIAYCGLLIS